MVTPQQFETTGWAHFPADPALRAWVHAAHDAVLTLASRAKSDCQGTWFVGVDALPNDPTGALDGQPLAGQARAFAETLSGPLPLHQAQLSVIYPGYPRPRDGENDAAFRYRLTRDAAHVDGLIPTGPDRRRHLLEPHAWVLGLPLTDTSADASPMVLWEGSHHLIRDAFTTALAPHDPATWHRIDLTEIYQSTRRRIFETCRRITLHARPTEAYLIHRMTLHGVAPWADTANAPAEGRMIAYLRPEWPGGAPDWIALP